MVGVTKFIKSSQEYYGCDGINKNCIHEIPIDDVNWFTSRIGFCQSCWDKLHRIPSKILDFCYDRAENDDNEIIDFVISLTA